MKEAACSIIPDSGRVLMICRADSNLLAFPGGKRELNELPTVTANRETYEETGFITLPYGKDFCQQVDEFTVHCYLATIVGGKLRSSSEGKVGWYNIEYIRSNPQRLAYPKWTANMLAFYGI